MQNLTQVNTERVCPVCGGSRQEHFAEECFDPDKISDFTYASRKQPEFMCLHLVRCRDCDLVYAPSPPSIDFLSAAYREAAYNSAPEAQAAAHSYAKALAPHIAHLAGRDAAVDVGAGSGALLPWLKKSGFNPVIGIEPSPAAIETAPPAVRAMLREGIFSPELLTDVRPSLLCSFMTLEHLADPGEFVGAAFELLQPSGMIAAVVHNWRAPLNRLLGMKSPIVDIEHLQLFSPQSLRAVLEKSGFESIHVQSICNSYPLRYWLRLTPLPTGIKDKVAGILDHLGVLDTHVALHVGNMLAVGIKPTKDKND